jgi:hypothetical protein
MNLEIPQNSRLLKQDYIEMIMQAREQVVEKDNQKTPKKASAF